MSKDMKKGIIVLIMAVCLLFILLNDKKNSIKNLKENTKQVTLTENSDSSNTNDSNGDSNVDQMEEDISDSTDEDNTDNTFEDNFDNTNEENQVQYYNNDLKSLEEITNDIILNQSMGYNTLLYACNYSDDRFEISVKSFTGLDHNMIVHADKEAQVTFHYKSSMDKNQYKLCFVVNQKEILELPNDKEEYICTIPKGDTIVTLAAYQANGTIEVLMDAQDGVKFIQKEE